MLRALAVGLTLLHLGPGLAFALLAFGCDGTPPPLGEVCFGSGLASFARLTFAAWGVCALALAAVHLVGRARRAPTAATAGRVAALGAVLAAGAALAAVGTWLTGSQAWWLAVPSTLAVAWMALANPLACQPESRTGGAADDDRAPSSAPGHR
jgi:hypothetical protein